MPLSGSSALRLIVRRGNITLGTGGPLDLGWSSAFSPALVIGDTSGILGKLTLKLIGADRKCAVRNSDAALAAAAVHSYLTATERDEADEEEGNGGASAAAAAASPSAEVAATFEVMFLTGWSPSRSQPKASKRGSATISFAELAKHVEEQERKEKEKAGGEEGGVGR